jgi:hypothetical protein
MGTSDVTLDVSQLITKEVTYKGSFRYGVRLSASRVDIL